MNLTVIGTGYVGLVSGTCLADIGNNVVCLDIDKSRIDKLNKAEVPFYEPGLEALIKTNIEKESLFFTSTYEEALSFSDYVFICVGTPSDEKGSADLSFIENTVIQISNFLKDQNRNIIVFIKSTVPSGTCKYLQNQFDSLLENSSSSVIVASNPEFLKEGSAVGDFMKPDRIIIGTNSDLVAKVAISIYRPVNWKTNRLNFVSIEAAEIIKYASNAFLATKISFINEIARLCDSVGADISEVRKGIGLDQRIGNNFLYAGLGYGGSCFPKDVKALISTFNKNELDAEIIKATIKVNDSQLEYFINKLNSFYTQEELQDKTIAVWGLSFKPMTDDIRESISIKLINLLSNRVKKLKVYDPSALDKAKLELSNIDNISFSQNASSALDNSDALVIATEWREFWNPDLKALSKLRDKVIFDGRNILDKDLLELKGFSYFGIGR